MGKGALKKRLGYAGDPSLVDTHRLRPKKDGGVYTVDNVRVLAPRAHMQEHGTLRTRDAQLADLKAVFDDRVQTMRLLLKVRNQQLAYLRRTDDQYLPTATFLTEMEQQAQERMRLIDNDLKKRVRAFAEVDTVAAAALSVRGMGEITVAALAVYVDLEKARCASALWRYCGYDKPSHARYEKGVAGGGNKTLRTVLFNTVNAMWKDVQSPYRLVGERVKDRLAVSVREVQSRNTQGRLVTVPWKDTKAGHRHGAALRAMAKAVLADYWITGRTLRGLDARPLYVEEKLGHTKVTPPSARGWPSVST